MRSKVIASVLALILIAAFSVAAFAQATSRPKGNEKEPCAVITETKFNLGDVLEGQDYGHSFVIRNAGGAELQILSVRPG